MKNDPEMENAITPDQRQNGRIRSGPLSRSRWDDRV